MIEAAEESIRSADGRDALTRGSRRVASPAGGVGGLSREAVLGHEARPLPGGGGRGLRNWPTYSASPADRPAVGRPAPARASSIPPSATRQSAAVRLEAQAGRLAVPLGGDAVEGGPDGVGVCGVARPDREFAGDPAARLSVTADRPPRATHSKDRRAAGSCSRPTRTWAPPAVNVARPLA